MILAIGSLRYASKASLQDKAYLSPGLRQPGQRTEMLLHRNHVPMMFFKGSNGLENACDSFCRNLTYKFMASLVRWLCMGGREVER